MLGHVSVSPYPVQIPDHEVVRPTFMVGLQTSINPIKKKFLTVVPTGRPKCRQFFEIVVAGDFRLCPVDS